MGKWVRIADGSGAVWVEDRRFRLMCFRRPLAPWRETRAEAEQDAVDLREGTRYHKTVYLTVPAWIMVSDATAETEADLRPRHRRHLVEVASEARIRSHRR